MQIDVRDWLSRGWAISREIKSLQSAQLEAWLRCTSTTQNLSGEIVSSSKDPHKFDSFAAFETSITGMLERLYAVQNEILQTINKVNDPTIRAVLIERFVTLHTLQQTADELHYSKKQIQRIQSQGFKAVQDVLECPS